MANRLRLRPLAAALSLVAWLAASLVPRAAHADEASGVKWNPGWTRVQPIELGLILANGIGSVLVDQYVPYAEEAHWTGPILFDGPARSFFRGRDRQTQRLAAQIGDYIYIGSTFIPHIVDNYIFALGVHQDPDVAVQMTLMDVESLGITGVVTLATEHLSGRQRPYVQDCTGPDNTPKDASGQPLHNTCGNPRGDNLSFYSGHAAAAFTMAGVTCAHHQHLPLYGGGFADAMACVTMVGLASTSAVTRMIADRHWASDVLIGAAVGTLSGYVLPSWLHYGFGRSRTRPTAKLVYGRRDVGYLMPSPIAVPNGAALGVVGMF